MRKHYADVAQCKPHFSLHLFGFTPPDDVYLYRNLLFPDMKRLTLLLALFCSALMSIVSCDKPGSGDPSPEDGPTDIPEEYGDFELAEGEVFMTEDMTSMFSSVEDGKIVLSGAAPAESIPSVGTVIICPITEKTPCGLLVKVVAVSGNVLTTEPASLADAFDELHVDAVMDMSQYLMHGVDKDGNITEPDFMTSEEWEALMPQTEDTKAEVSVSQEFTPVSFPIEAGEFEGSIFMKFELNAKIDISRTMKVNSFEFTVTRTTGVGGGWDITKTGEWKKTYFEKELVFKPFLIPGTPLAFVPKLYAEVGAKAEGTAEFKADVEYIFERQTYTASTADGGAPVFTSVNDPVVNEECFKFHHLALDGKVALTAAAGGKICLYNEDVLAVGGELEGEAAITASAAVSMEDERLLIQNPEMALNVGITASVYAESLLFRLVPGNDEGRLSRDFPFDLVTLELHALPAYSDLKRSSSESTRSISGKFDKYGMIICEEKGFALFEQGGSEALQHIATSKADRSGSTAGSGTRSGYGTKAVELPKEDGLATFTVNPDSDTMYETKPYVKAYGIYFYGEGEDIWVDLGLPSGILWAKYNVGANSPEEYGGFYAWGETSTKNYYGLENYKHASIIGYFENEPVYSMNYIGHDISNTDYDVAHVTWGNGARMPTIDECKELLNNCTIEDIGNLFQVTGPNSNSIYFPAGGYYSKSIGGFWSSTLRHSETQDEAYCVFLEIIKKDNIIEWGYEDRHVAAFIRPVKDKETDSEN